MDADGLAGAAVGLMGVAILVNVAGKMIDHDHHHHHNKPAKLKPTKSGKMKW